MSTTTKDFLYLIQYPDEKRQRNVTNVVKYIEHSSVIARGI